MFTALFGFAFGLSFTSAHLDWKRERDTWLMWVVVGIIFWAALLYV